MVIVPLSSVLATEQHNSSRRNSAVDVLLENSSSTNCASRTTSTRLGRHSLEVNPWSLVHTERRGAAVSGSWRIKDIDWSVCFKAQHYGTAFFAVFVLIALAIIHWTAHPAQQPFFLYDASISYLSSHGDTVPAAAAVLCLFASLLIFLVLHDFFIYRNKNWNITNAMATSMHFLLDCICAFATVECFTETTKMCAGRLRPDYF